MDRVGVFTKEQENFLTEVILSKIKVDNFFFNLVKKKGIRLLISSIDNFGLDKIKPTWKVFLIPIIDTALAKRYDEAREMIAILLDSHINFKGVKDVTEQKFFESITISLASAIDMYIQMKISA